MDPIRSSIGGGVAATAVLTVFLIVPDVLLEETNLFLYSTFAAFCGVGADPYCAGGSQYGAVLSFFWFVFLFVLAWPLVFGGFTWGIPGESGAIHGFVFGIALWSGYVVVTGLDFVARGIAVTDNVPLLIATFVAYSVYGVVLGATYDYLAHHRTFLDMDLGSS